MSVFPKFIIETDPKFGDCLIISNCTYHKQLANDITKVKGVGMFRFDSTINTIFLSGKSQDFGKASLEDIKNCIKLGNVFTNNTLKYSITQKRNFSYIHDWAEIVKLTNF